MKTAPIQIGYVLRPCSLGIVLVAATERGVCLVLLGDEAAPLIRSLKRRFPSADLREDERRVAEWASKIVAGWDSPGQPCDLPLDIRGTAFQRQVWDALRAIPPGTTSTYAEIAKRIGRPKAIRAVGNACGANPVAPVIPCHRVLASDGTLGGYGFGLERKRTLLERECVVGKGHQSHDRQGAIRREPRNTRKEKRGTTKDTNDTKAFAAPLRGARPSAEADG